jgi:diguanylate cyclase (GGDEF)-like protein
VWSFRDVSEHRRLAAELAHQAFHDALTGLANQALFRDRVGHALERLGRDGSRVAVLFIDLDDFKRVNDSLGHSAGDEMLVTVAARISSCLRAGDTASRLGGDEFAVLIDDVRDDGDAVALAERILEALRRPTAVGAGPVGTASSIGIAYGEPGMDVDELLRNADLAMYTAKAAGKNCCRVYERSMHDAAVARLDLETRLRGAADRGELLVDYQPVMDLRTGRIESMEALVRWLHPERGLLAPGAFVPFAEEGGLIGEIGSHVLATACAAATRWVEEFGDAAPSVSVNLSPRQLADEDLPERIEGLLSSVGLRPDRLTLEITEGELMRDPVGAGLSLERLSALGVRLAVDDFGTGYSALAYLRQFPVDVLKVDRSFLGRARDDDSWRLAHAIVQISHALGLVPVAEGVERADQVDVLRSFGCELGQGYHLARPMSADAATDAIRRSVAALGEGPRVRGPAPPRPSASGAAQTAGSR